MTRVFIFALALLLAGKAEGDDMRLEALARFLARHYCEDGRALERSIQFTAPLTGIHTRFLHFEWQVSTADQYGKNRDVELDGVVRYTRAGELQQLVVGGPLAADERLRELRRSIVNSRGWPNAVTVLPFGPQAEGERVASMAVRAIKDLIGVPMSPETVAFCVLNPLGEPDGTWHVQLRNNEEDVTVTVRIEPFEGKVIQADVERKNSARRPDLP